MQTWVLTECQVENLRTTSRSILGIKFKDKVRVESIQAKSNTKDIGGIVEQLELGYARHLAKDFGKWNKAVEEWTPLD